MYYKIHMSFHQVISDLSILLQDIFHKTKTAKWKLRLYWNILITFWGAKTVPKDSPLFTEFSRQEHWSGLPFPSPGDLADPGPSLHLLHCRWILYHWATREAQEIWGNESYCSDWSLIPAYGVWPEGWRMLHGRTAASAETRFEVRGSISFQKEEGAIVDRRVVWEQKNKETNQASTTTI